jgi:hypothetical protein
MNTNTREKFNLEKSILEKLQDLGFSDWELKSATYKENAKVPLGVLYDIQKWVLEEFGIYLEIILDTDSLYFWKMINVKTRKELDRTLNGFDSPELSLIDAISTFINHHYPESE